MIRRLVAILATALLVVLAGGGLASGATRGAAPSAAHMYLYDSPVYDAPGTELVSERGPPAVAHPDDPGGAGDHWLRGTSARVAGSTHALTTTYAYIVTPEQAVETAPTTGVDVLLADGAYSPLRRSVSAAKTTTGAESALSGARLSTHLRQLEKYGQGGF